MPAGLSCPKDGATALAESLHNRDSPQVTAFDAAAGVMASKHC